MDTQPDRRNREVKIIFIAGPYYGDGKSQIVEKNIKGAERYAVVPANRGIAFFCYATHTAYFNYKANAPETFYKSLDVEILIHAADALLALPTQKESPGAKGEVALAKKTQSADFLSKIVK